MNLHVTKLNPNYSSSRFSAAQFSAAQFLRALIVGLVICCSHKAVVWAEDTIIIRPATVQLIDKRTISAADAGLLAEVFFSEGQQVKGGSIVASLDDVEQKILVQAAEVNLEAARLNHSQQHALETARNALSEVAAATERIQALRDMSQKKAEDESAVKIAKAELAEAETELKRAEDSRARFLASVSDAEYLRLQTKHVTATLNLLKSESDFTIAKLQPRINEAELKEQKAKIQKFTSMLNQEDSNIQLNALTVKSREQELARANVLLGRRDMVSPINGVVAEVFKKPGEWVEKGTPILHIIDLSELRVEGFIGIADISADLIGRDAEVEFSSPNGARRIRGVVTHILPDVDPVNQYAPIWIRFANPDNTIFPGVIGEVRILQTSLTASGTSGTN